MGKEILTQEQFVANSQTVTSLLSSGELRTKDPKLVSGLNANANTNVALGRDAAAPNHGIAIGSGASATGLSAIQLGKGTNSNDNTFSVFNYSVLTSTGKLELPRLPNWAATNVPADVRANLSLSPLATAAEAPLDGKTYYRLNGEWTDTLISTSPNGVKRRIFVDNDGLVKTTEVN